MGKKVLFRRKPEIPRSGAYDKLAGMTMLIPGIGNNSIINFLQVRRITAREGYNSTYEVLIDFNDLSTKVAGQTGYFVHGAMGGVLKDGKEPHPYLLDYYIKFIPNTTRFFTGLKNALGGDITFNTAFNPSTANINAYDPVNELWYGALGDTYTEWIQWSIVNTFTPTSRYLIVTVPNV